MHFRIAESQFYRLIEAGNNVKVDKVEYVVNPELVRRFNAARKAIR